MKLSFIILFSLNILCLINCRGQKVSEQKSIIIDLDSIYYENLKDSSLATGWYYVNEGKSGLKRQLDKSDEFYYIDPKPIVVKENFMYFEIYETNFKETCSNYIGLKMQFDKVGTKAWAIATKRAISKRLALIIDNVLIVAPIVNDQIKNGVSAINRNDYSTAELQNFITKIKD
jgi:preprotein translocase subunit SecD